MRDDAAVVFAAFPNVADHLANAERGFVRFPSELRIGNSAPDFDGSATNFLQVQPNDVLGSHARDRIKSGFGSGCTSNRKSAAYTSVEVQHE